MPFQSQNMHYVFNTEYLNKLAQGDCGDVSRSNVEILETVNRVENREQILAYGKAISEQLCKAGALQQEYVVSYPGLLVGTGYPHITRSSSGEVPTGMIQIGFTFDYATGVPYYPGTSLKGVLRAPFDRAFPEEGAPDKGAFRYLAAIMAEATKGRLTEVQITEETVKTFRDEVFEGLDTAAKEKGATLPLARRDVFYGAFLTAAEAKGGKILGFDNLTPHQESISTKVMDNKHVVLDEDVTKNPVPLTMLRILPKTVMTFSMKLNDGTVFPKEEKFRIIRRIIEDFGIGAKTNVGYGIMTPYERPAKTCAKCGKETNEWNEFDGTIFCENCFAALALCAECHKRPAAIDPNTHEQGRFCKECLAARRNATANITPEEKERLKEERKAREREKKRLKREEEKRKNQAAKG